MGNSVGKIEENEWEFTVRVKKRPLTRRHDEEQELVGDDQNGREETVGEFEFGIKASPKSAPLNLTPLNVGSPGPASGKKRSRKTSPDSAAATEEVNKDFPFTPRGRKSTCVKIMENGNSPPSLDIRMLKSHLAPLWNLIIPAEFVTKHMLKDNKDSKTYDIVNGDKCKTLQVIKAAPPSRFILSKKHWQEFALEHKLELEDSIRLELLSENEIRVEVFKKDTAKKPEVDVPDPTAEEEDAVTAVPVPLMTVDSMNTGGAEESRQ